MVYQLSRKYPQKRAFVTGAASGLGKAFCMELAKDDWMIAMTDIDIAALHTAAEDVRMAGGRPYIFPFDVADSEQFGYSLRSFLDKAGSIDLLINNAGVGEATLFEEYSPENWNWIIGVNQSGTIYGCHFVIPHMKKQGYGQIINIASAAGFANLPRMSPYNVTKAAVIALSESLYAELKPFQVRVSVATPTFFQSSILQHARGNLEIKASAEKIVKNARIDAEEAARTILKGAGRGTFLIVFPLQGKLLYFLKRLFPVFFRKCVTFFLKVKTDK